MNVELLDRIATWLEAGAPHQQNRGMAFDMLNMLVVKKDEALTNENWCGTCCCIAGAAVSFGSPEAVAEVIQARGFNYLSAKEEGLVNVAIWNEGRTLLGLDHDQATWLFAPFDRDAQDEADYYGEDAETSDWTRPEHHEITPEWAAHTIRHLIATDVVDWAQYKAVSA